MSQEYGPVRTYGASERLYSTLAGDLIARESYLMSDRTYRTEDSFGHEGIIRYVFKYSDGQTDTALMNFSVRCGAVESDEQHVVRIWENDPAVAQEIKVSNAGSAPTGLNKDAYDLFHAVCSEGIQPYRPRSRQAPNQAKRPTRVNGGCIERCYALIRRKCSSGELTDCNGSALAQFYKSCRDAHRKYGTTYCYIHGLDGP